jgi:hypothetical protein
MTQKAVVRIVAVASILATGRIVIFPVPVALNVSTPAVSVVAVLGAPAPEME